MGYQGNILFLMHEWSSISSILHHIAINLQPEPDIVFMLFILDFQREMVCLECKKRAEAIQRLKAV